ncbi:hypothetical protein CHS0354_034702, partial [Potamilus streckersoni]
MIIGVDAHLLVSAPPPYGYDLMKDILSPSIPKRIIAVGKPSISNRRYRKYELVPWEAAT